MKICITARGTGLDSQIDPRFGRCRFFFIVDPDSLEFETIDNNGASSGGAGIQAGQLVSEKGVEYVITGSVGPNAFDTLQAAGIKIMTSLPGPIREVIERFNKGTLTLMDQPDAGAHSGIK